MQLLNPWSIFDELERSMLSGSSMQWPQFDIEESDDETILTADLPGMREDDLEITVSGHYLIVRGERKPTAGGRHVRRRRFYGAFERQFYVGDQFDLDHVKAHLQDGVLAIRLAKAAKARPRRIKLTTGVVDKVKGLLGGGSKDKEHDKAA